MKMNNFMQRFILLVMVSGIFSVLTTTAQNARIKIDVDRQIGEINKNLFGNFVEHLGRCVYGGIYEPDSPLSDDKGIRLDVLDAVKELNVPLTRYPGGNFVSNYHWKDGIGPKDQRQTRMELAWARLETNQFGTDEFVEYARRIGTDPYLAVNLGTGTIEEAQQWVEYCNVKEGPYYAELRKKYGHPEPYNIKYWSLGNEMDGFWQMGHLNAEDYSKKAREAAKLMRLTDPSIKLVAAGASNFRPNNDPHEWNATVLSELKDVVDYIALHMYVGNHQDNYYNFVSSPLVLEERTKVVKGMILREMEKADRGDRDPIYIAWDEYNIWYRWRAEETMTGDRALEERYNLEDALVIAGFLNAFIRNADIVKMANMAQLVNVIAPIFAEKDGMFKQTIYYPLQLFANNMFGTSLDVFVDCEAYDTDEFYLGLAEQATQQNNVPYLDVSAAYNKGEVVVCVINRHKDNTIETDIISQEGLFDGEFEVYEINGPDIKAENDFDKTNVQTVQKESVKVKKTADFSYSFPPHSFTMLKGKIVK
ncbi:alpha-N-arabinofuranosidase [Maribellus comscasis]|uniref:non-reducing end alpha-L-arabinofuranosidase n=1 Tax=Maribellus comscasis TaxID=2681766 RepID=A0A6I6JGV3_9BACT|nr:alpha-L-arabinofuranosidase C-terminal domain-containing protein [Maribellus comscasis]QGY42105.1 alpha-N-arabinofuranosidase [Maribellus comscasis]